MSYSTPYCDIVLCDGHKNLVVLSTFIGHSLASSELLIVTNRGRYSIYRYMELKTIVAETYKPDTAVSCILIGKPRRLQHSVCARSFALHAFSYLSLCM